LVAALGKLQKENGWTDEYVASRLGVTRPLWSLVRRGLKPMRYKVLTGILTGFGPELASDAFFFVASGVTDSTITGEQ
jgi:transcriptional regulator with XRE-family HTH domain